LFADNETTPKNHCEYERIENCIDQPWNSPTCLECDAGYFNLETSCDSCGIERCAVCEEIEASSYTCVECDVDDEVKNNL